LSGRNGGTGTCPRIVGDDDRPRPGWASRNPFSYCPSEVEKLHIRRLLLPGLYGGIVRPVTGEQVDQGIPRHEHPSSCLSTHSARHETLAAELPDDFVHRAAQWQLALISFASRIYAGVLRPCLHRVTYMSPVV
jgi:hypothetical protein